MCNYHDYKAYTKHIKSIYKAYQNIYKAWRFTMQTLCVYFCIIPRVICLIMTEQSVSKMVPPHRNKHIHQPNADRRSNIGPISLSGVCWPDLVIGMIRSTCVTVLNSNSTVQLHILKPIVAAILLEFRKIWMAYPNGGCSQTKKPCTG